MCTSLFLYDVHPGILFLLTFNRDEFYERPTKEAHFWEDIPGVLGGRDLLGSGTWLGITNTGRIALLTNFREPNYNSVKNSPSRGALAVDFLKSKQSPMEYLQSLPPEAYNGFNLIVGDLQARRLGYLTNRGSVESLKQPQELLPGLYGISNGVLGDRWVKVSKGQEKLQMLLASESFQGGQVPWEAIFEDIMGDRQRVADEAQLPDTGVPKDMEWAMSSIFVEPFQHPAGGLYGTRSQTVLAVWRDGRAELRERCRGTADEWKEVLHSFTIQGLAHDTTPVAETLSPRSCQ